MKVSVVIPTYNRATQLEKAVKSALSQTFPPLEILICDDGSTDNTREVIHRLKDKRIRWLPGVRSGGPAKPRNRGIKKSKGEWLAFLDSDDIWLPEKLEKQHEQLNKLNCLACSTNAQRKIRATLMEKPLIQWQKEIITLNDLLENNHVVCSSALIHSSLIKKVIGFVEDDFFKNFADYTLWLRVASLTNFAYVNSPLVIYKDDPKSSLRKDNYPEMVIKAATRHNFLLWKKNLTK